MFKTNQLRALAIALTFFLAVPLAVFATAQPVRAQTTAPKKKGMSTRTKVLILAGAALLYYLYRRHQKMAAQKAANGGKAGRTAQLYRSKNGGVYYRDPSGKAIWLTVPSQPVRVPADQVQQYAPDYNQYQGPAPANPAGAQTRSFSDLDPGAIAAPGSR